MSRIFFFLLSISSALFSEEPWGMDSSLLPQTRTSKKSASTPLLQAIAFHQTCLSLADGPRSHFYPSSSEYSKKAFVSYGTTMGLLLTFDRLMRENDDRWVYKVYTLASGMRLTYDPLPKLLAPEHTPFQTN